MKIAIVTGGTGGHIYPALSFAHLIQDQYPDAEILFIGNQERMESKIIPEAGFEFKGLSTKSITGNIVKKALRYAQVFLVRKEANQILKEFKPDWVLGFGGYVCVPVILEANKMRIATFLHEQNAIAGKANKYLASKVTGIIASYPKNLEDFPKNKTRLLGNPRSYDVKVNDHPDILKSLNLDPKLKTVLFVMGSLGAESLFEVASSVLETLAKENVQSIFVTGQKHYDEFIAKNDETKFTKIVPYIDQVKAMQEVDLMVTRGGATTAAEIMVLGVASIIIPSPYVPNNHQFFNAKELFEAQGCEIIEEKDLNVFKLHTDIMNILLNDNYRLSLQTNAKKCAYPNAAEDMLNWILMVLSS